MKQELIWLMQRIPYGMVVSYGELASQLDRQYSIHTSGWLVWRMLNTLTPKDYPSDRVVPRWRVINKQWVDQINLLRKEWVQVTDRMVDMRIYEYNFI